MMRLCALFTLFLLLPIAATAKPLVADLSQYTIAIDSGFTGTHLLLFGSRANTGDIVVVVRGPQKEFVVRKKERIAGVWTNRRERKFQSVPEFYALASSRPLDAIGATALLAPLGIGLNEAVASNTKDPDPVFAAALLRQAQQKHLYSLAPEPVSFMGDTLFKFSIPFPDTIPGGDYSADVYLFNGDQLVGMQSIPLHVEKSGLDAFVYDFSRDHSVLYGLFAVWLALCMGWGASRLMQRA